MTDAIGSSDDRALAALKGHPDSAATVLKGDASTLAQRVEALYTRVWGALKADWNWIANELHLHHAPTSGPLPSPPVTDPPKEPLSAAPAAPTADPAPAIKAD
jgi:hypothetical protein